MNLLSTTINNFAQHDGKLYVFSSAGVDVYRISDFKRLMVAGITSTCGAVNDAGIFLGTAEGIYFLPHGLTGDQTTALSRLFAAAGAIAVISDNGVTGLAGRGGELLVTTAAGADYFPTLGENFTVYRYTDPYSACANPAISSTKIAYSGGDGVHVITKPTADWSTSSTTFLPVAYVYDSFAGSAVDTGLWTVTDTDSTISVADGAMSIDVTTTDTATSVSLVSVGTMTGDFDVRVRFSGMAITGLADITGLEFLARASGSADDKLSIKAAADNNDSYISTLVTGGVAGTATSTSRASNNGTLRVTRTGSTLKTWIDDGDSGTFTQLGGDYTNATISTIDLQLVFYRPSTSEAAGVIVEAVEVHAGTVGTVTLDNLIGDTVNALAYGTDLFIATDAGVSVYDGTTVTDFTSTALGTVVDAKAVWPASDATDSAGVFAYATSNGSDGGRFGIYNITGAANETTVSGDVDSAWTDDDWQAAVYDGTLDQYANFEYLSPAPDAYDVQRSWTLYAEITDSLGGLTAASVTLTVDGTSQTPTTTSITNGYKVTYTPASASSYGQRHSIVLSATDADGHSISRSWSFRCTAELPSATSSAPPDLVVGRDISLSATDADDTHGGTNVIWARDITHPLIVDEDQAQAVGTVVVEDGTYHRHRRTLLVGDTDDNDDQVGQLQEGDVITFTSSALGETTQKAVVLAKQMSITARDGVQYQLLVEYYESL